MNFPTFELCPACGEKSPEFTEKKRIFCKTCDWVFYFNTATAVGALLEHEKNVVLIRRNQNPGKGLLDVPGGFVDPGESLEAALSREIMEEIHLEINQFSYLFSLPNTYPYRGITYTTCDAIFSAELAAAPTSWCTDEVQEVVIIDPKKLDLAEVAFDSIRESLERFITKR